MNLLQGLKAVASDRRLRILRLLAGAEATRSSRRGLNASALCDHLGISQPALSEQMQVLLATRLVGSRREGREVIYFRDEERILQFREMVIAQLLVLATGAAASGSTNDHGELTAAGRRR